MIASLNGTTDLYGDIMFVNLCAGAIIKNNFIFSFASFCNAEPYIIPSVVPNECPTYITFSLRPVLSLT